MTTPTSVENIDVVFTFDTTGSMAPCLAQVRRVVKESVRRLFREVPGLRIGIGCHGDYCDAGSSYVTKWLDLTNDEDKIVKFVTETGSTGGGDMPECYELVLHEARSLAWRSGRAKVLCMIGDDVPHEPTYPDNKKRIDWRNELGLLLEGKIQVYGIQALNRRHATHFWREIAARTKGLHLELDQFASIVDIIMGVCFRQDSPEALKRYEEEVRSKGRMTRAVDKAFATLGGREVTREFVATDLTAVPAGRFQVLHVDADVAIKDFVLANGATFKKGRGFYLFTKPEEVQDYKEVILQHKKTGDFFSGARARELLGLPARGTVKLSPKSVKDADSYRIFIQSTSVNRKLIGDTDFLYEVDDWDRKA